MGVFRHESVNVAAPDGRRWERVRVVFMEEDRALRVNDTEGRSLAVVPAVFMPTSQRSWEFHAPGGVWLVTAAGGCNCG